MSDFKLFHEEKPSVLMAVLWLFAVCCLAFAVSYDYAYDYDEDPPVAAKKVIYDDDTDTYRVVDKEEWDD